MRFQELLKVRPYRDEDDGAGGGGASVADQGAQEPTLAQVLEAINGVRTENDNLRNEFVSLRDQLPTAPVQQQQQQSQTPYEASPYGEMPLTEGDWIAYNKTREDARQKSIDDAVKKTTEALRGEMNTFTGGLVRQNAMTQLSQGLDQYEVEALTNNLQGATPQQIAMMAGDPQLRQQVVWAAKGAAIEKRPLKVDAPTGSDMGLGNYVGDGLNREQAGQVQKMMSAFQCSRDEAVSMVKDAYADFGNPLITKERSM